MKKLIFVGERPSKLAETRKWSWSDGRLAGKQLFDGLLALGIDPTDAQHVRFGNVWATADATVPDHNFLCGLRNHIKLGWQVVGLGAKAQKELAKWGIAHLAMRHPAARGAVRSKASWCAHVADVLSVADFVQIEARNGRR